jgi:hypothetical protein
LQKQDSETYLHPKRGETPIENSPPKQGPRIVPETVETEDLNTRLAKAEVLEDAAQQKKEQKATKADDAAVPGHIWETHLLNDGPTPWVVKDVDELRKAMNLLRQRMLRWWKRKVTTSFFEWSHQRYPELVRLGEKHGNGIRLVGAKYQWVENDPYQTALGGKEAYRKWWTSCLLHAGEDIHPAADAIERTSNLSWWNWDDGSRLLHWRWPEWYMRVIRDGLPVHFRSDKPTYRKPQRDEKDGATKARKRKKLAAVRERRYIRSGFVKSLTSYFSVPKGEEDIRMVYDGSASGLNNSIWVPQFVLPTVNTQLWAVNEDTHMADADVGECFLNFLLHPNLCELAGVDLTPLFGEDGLTLWEIWVRDAMGIKSSPYQAVSAMTVADEIFQGDRSDKDNVFKWVRVRLYLPGDLDYDPNTPWVSKVRDDDKLASDLFILWTIFGQPAQVGSYVGERLGERPVR